MPREHHVTWPLMGRERDCFTWFTSLAVIVVTFNPPKYSLLDTSTAFDAARACFKLIVTSSLLPAPKQVST